MRTFETIFFPHQRAGGDAFHRLIRASLVCVLTVAGISFPAFTARAAGNSIVVENQNPGTTAWKLGQAGYLVADDTNRQIEGYASTTSVNKGESLDFFVSVNTAQNFTADIYRLGYYGGTGGRLMGHVGPLAGFRQNDCPVDATTGLVACNWSSSFSYTIPVNWTSGVYVVTLTNANKYQRYVTFVVRDDQRNSDFLYQQSVTTYQAYNVWPVGSGKSLYDFNSYGATVPATGGKRAAKVTFDRPYADGYGAGQLVEPGWGWERYYVSWLEQSGYDVAYATDLDTHANGSRILSHKAFLSAGHDEYWSRSMLDAVTLARDSGVDLGFFGSNTAYWQVRFESSAAGRADRVMTCYKSASLDPVKDSTAGVLWRDPPASSPEQSLVGVQYTAHLMNEGAGAMYVVQNSANWVWQGTGVTDGTSIPGILGYETDAYMPEYPAPTALSRVLLSDSPVTDAAGVAGRANSSIYQAPSGAWVFASGTNHWSYGLGKSGGADPRIQQATKNILNRFIDYVPPPPSAPAPPSGVSASALSSTSIDVTWQDNSDNELGFVVERSADGGGTWTVLTPTIPINTTIMHDTALTGGVSYAYRVKAINDVGVSGYAVSSALTLPPASSVVFSDDFTGADGSPWSAARWTGAVGAGAWDIQANGGRLAIANVANDRVQARALMPRTVDTETLTSVRYTTTGPRGYLYIFGRGSGDWVAGYPGTSYFLQLTNDGAAAALWKSVNGVTTQLVSNASAAAVTTTKQWVRLRIQGAAISAKIWTDGTAEPSAWELSATDSSITSAGVFQVRMYRSGSSTATREAVIDDLVVTNLAPIVLPPIAPTSLVATSVSSTAIDLAWKDNAMNEAAYAVERSSDGLVWTVLTASLPPNTTQYRDSGLVSGASYRYRVRADNAGGSSAYSAVAQAATGYIPAAPTGLTVTDRTFETVNLSWTDNATNETAYVVERAPQGATDWAAVELPADATSWRETGLASSTTYSYRVKARNEVGDSATTVIVTATTLPQPLQPPVPPSNLTATAMSTTSVAVAWVDNAGNESGYAVERSADVGLNWTSAGSVLPAGGTTLTDTGLTPDTTYAYRVRAVNAAGVSAWSATATATTYRPLQPPAAPSGLVATGISRSEIDLSWVDNATTESGYRVESSTDAGQSWSMVSTLPANSASYRVSNLLAGTSYAYRVVATNEAGTSAPSNTAQATTLPPPPSAPTGLTAVAVSPTEIALSWVDTSTTEISFSLERASAGGSWTILAELPSGTQTFSDQGLSPNQTYSYRVRVRSAQDWSAYSTEATATTPAAPPAAPSDVTATPMSASAVDLTWMDNASDETAFAVQRSPDGGITWTTLTAQLPADTLHYRDVSASPETRYGYRVRAENAAGASPWSAIAWAITPVAPPERPGNLTAVAAPNRIDLSWTDNATTETAFAVERSTDGGIIWATLAAGLPADTTSYRDAGLPDGVTSAYRVRAGNASGWSDYSGVASATTPTPPPADPTSLTAVAVSSSLVDLAWTHVATTETAYRVERSSDGGATWTVLADALGAGTQNYRDAAASAETAYVYRVAAVNAGGASGYATATVVTPPAPPSPPAAPTGLTAGATSASTVALTWTDNASNETAYVLDRSVDGGLTWVLVTSSLPADTSSFTDSGLSSSTTYRYRVRAENAGGPSAWSAVASATTQSTPPMAPTALTGTSTSAWSVDLAWVDNAVDETAYVVERSVDGGANWITLTATLPAGTTAYRDSGVKAATAYTYRLRATNAGGTSTSAVCAVTTRSLLFSDVFTGANGSSWSTTKWAGSATSGSWTIQSNAGRMRLNSSSTARVQVTAKMAAATDSELLTSVRFSTTTTAAKLDLFGRASGDWVNGSPTTGLFLRVANNNTQLQLWSTAAGKDTLLSTAPAGGAVTTTKQWVRLRIQGNTMSARVWTDGTVEPSGWEISASGLNVLTGGVLQAQFARSTSTGGTCDAFIDDLQLMP